MKFYNWSHSSDPITSTNHLSGELLLEYPTDDDDACGNIVRFWLNPITEQKMDVANGKLDELLEVHKNNFLTTNSLFMIHEQKKTTDQTILRSCDSETTKKEVLTYFGNDKYRY